MAKTLKAKGYSKGSLMKLHKLFAEYTKKYSDKTAEEIKLCISCGNKKIGRVLNVSLPPIITCANCKECKHFCYDVKACLQYPGTVIDARIRNLTILKKSRALYFQTIRNKLSRRRTNKFFRWHVSGDIIDADYLDNMIQIAIDFPAFRFWTYTKNYNLVNEYIATHGGNKESAIPANLSIMFSEWKGLEMINPYGLPEFSCHFPDEPKPTCYKCPGNCDVCKAACKGCIAGENTYADLH